ncbi:MAG: hypothetical protein G8237_14900 [Magnetococcales bacterium]|nr:hypothetical protein [Magnetococcales bacterium]
MGSVGYLLVADMMGFSKMVRNLSQEQLAVRVKEWVDLVCDAAKKFNIDDIKLISDTIFVFVEPGKNNFENLVCFSREILLGGIQNSFPIRGAIVYGEVAWGSVIYGQAVIDAHELEQSQNWIGIACAANIVGVDSLWSIDRLICYPVPKKQGAIQQYPVVSWDVPDLGVIMRLLMGGGLTKTGEVIDWRLGEILNNTIMFGLYQKLVIANKQNVSLGNLSMVLINDALNKSGIR